MKLATKKDRIRTKKERLDAPKKEQKNRDTVLMILSISFLLGGILGCLLEGSLSAEPYIRQFLEQSAQSAVAPSLWRELWTVFRWPVAVMVLGLLPLTGLTVPVLFFLRGFFLSYGIVALMEGLGGTGLLWASIVFGPTCLLAVPAFFVLGTAELLRKTAGRRRPIRFTVFCLPALIVCVCLDRAVAPRLLHFLLKAMAEG